MRDLKLYQGVLVVQVFRLKVKLIASFVFEIVFSMVEVPCLSTGTKFYLECPIAAEFCSGFEDEPNCQHTEGFITKSKESGM